MPFKYNDNIQEAYLDPEKKYYDYGTATYENNGDVIDVHHTGISFYDQFLTTRDIDYLRDKKNLQGTIVMMSPQKYYEECATNIFGCSVEKLKKGRGEYDRPIIDKLHSVLNVYKKKLCMPMINYADRGQEGLHRMLAIAELFGWDHKVPVLVVNWYDEERAENEKREAKKAEVDRKVEKAISRTLEYRFIDKEDVEIQLQSELDRAFEFDDIDVPETINLSETADSLILTFNNYEYPIEKDEIQWREETVDEDDTDIDDLESDEDFLVRYFGKDWRETHPHLRSTFNIKEDVNHTFDKETIIEVIEEHNHSYYQDSTMALEMICEKLYYEHNIDARYKGRSIYVGEKKIATLKVEREGPMMLGVYGYTLFI